MTAIPINEAESSNVTIRVRIQCNCGQEHDLEGWQKCPQALDARRRPLEERLHQYGTWPQ